MPDERTVYDAVTLFRSSDFRNFASPTATEEELAQDAASFASLDAIIDGRGYQDIEDIAVIVQKLSNDMKG